MGQLPHMAEQKQQGLVTIRSSPFNVDSEAFADKLQHSNGSGSSGEHHIIHTEGNGSC